jgi:hypothetical protein
VRHQEGLVCLTPALTCNRASTVSRRRELRSTTAGRGTHHGLGSDNLDA